jgi:outer membrane protein assembly factor BamB
MKRLIKQLSGQTNYYFIFILVVLLSTADALSQEWEGWRGLQKQGNSQSENSPTDWSPVKNVKWKADLIGEGHSSPVVSNEFVFISSAEKTKSYLKLNSIIVHFLPFIVFLIILYSLIMIIRDIVNITSKRELFQSFLICLCMGLVIFIFATMHWNYYNEKSKSGDRLIANWLFSGSSVLFLFLLALTAIPINKYIKPIISLAIIPFVYFLLKNRPFPVYYTLENLFNYHSPWNFSLMLQAVCLPLIAIIILIFISFLKEPVSIGKLSAPKRNSILAIDIIFFIIGASGFLLAPLITIAKVAYRKYGNGSSINIKFSEILDYTYPYFLAALCFGFLIVFLIQLRRVGISKIGWKWTFPLSFFFVIIFFIISNYSSKELLYDRYITCFNRQTGVQVWKVKGLEGPAIDGSSNNTQASPTPVINNGLVYAYFGSAGMMCVDFNGKLIWTNTNLPYKCMYGVGASPIKSSEGIVVCSANPSAPYVTTLDYSTGKPLWTQNLPSWGTAYGEFRTPTLLDNNNNNKESILEWNFSKNEIRFYDAVKGEIYSRFIPKWSSGGECIVSPIVSSDTLILTDRLGIHALSINKMLNEKDPMIWSTSLNGKGADVSSPVKVGDRIFIISSNGYVSCLNSKNGDIIWKDHIMGMFNSSIVSSGNYIYLSDTKCKTTVIRNKDKFEIVAQNDLNEELYSTITIVKDQLFIRTNKNLWCIGKQ